MKQKVKKSDGMKPRFKPMTGRTGDFFSAGKDKQPAACHLLVYDTEYPGVTADDDAAGNDKSDDKQGRFGRVATVVFQDGAGPQFAIQTEHACEKTHVVSYFYVTLDQYLDCLSHRFI
jgi:hypothetical protein